MTGMPPRTRSRNSSHSDPLPIVAIPIMHTLVQYNTSSSSCSSSVTPAAAAARLRLPNRGDPRFVLDMFPFASPRCTRRLRFRRNASHFSFWVSCTESCITLICDNNVVTVALLEDGGDSVDVGRVAVERIGEVTLVGSDDGGGEVVMLDCA